MTQAHKLARPTAGDVIAGRYRLERVLAKGGMGVVMVARQLSMDRDVAIKMILPQKAAEKSTLARFQREVQLAKQLKHPNIVELYDFGSTEGDAFYLVMELLEGEDLSSTIKSDGRMTVGRAGHIALQLLDALSEAHQLGIVHRDLKPSNVFLTTMGRHSDFVKLLDFGIAKSLKQRDDGITSHGQLFGTTGYIAPELFVGGSLSLASDIYAMGLMLLEMLIGQRVFRGRTHGETILLQLEGEFRIPSALEGTGIERVIRLATARSQDERYATAADMLAELESALEVISEDLMVSQEDADRCVARLLAYEIENAAFGESAAADERTAATTVIPGEVGDEPDTIWLDDDTATEPAPPIRSNLEAPSGNLIGRDSDLEVIQDLLESQRLVTLFGTAGLGKTAVARVAAHRWFEKDEDRAVYFVDWSRASDNAGMLFEVWNACQLEGVPRSNALGRLLGSRPTVLVLDTLEHVVEEASLLIAKWMEANPHITVLTTSRQRLHLHGERVYELAPLSTPPPGVESSTEFDAVRLFVERAREASFLFEDEGHYEAIGEITRRLDGIPLAIELAARRTSLFEPAEIASRLEERFRLLSKGTGSVPSRQSTLHGAIDWSWNLLENSEREVLARCAVFRSPFGEDDVAAIVDQDMRSDVELDRVLERLVEKSLTNRRGDKFYLMESIRAFAMERLEQTAAHAETEMRHVRWAATGVASVEDSLAALRTVVSRERGLKLGLQIVAELEDELITRGVGDEAIAVISRVIDCAADSAETTDEDLANARSTRGALHRVRGELDDAIVDLEYVVAAFPTRAEPLVELGIALHESGQRDRAERYYRVALERYEAIGEVRGIAKAVGSLAILLHERRELTEARIAYEHAMNAFEQVDDRRSLAAFSSNLGDLAREAHQGERAQTCYERAIDLSREIGDRRIEAVAIGNLGGLAADAGDYERARELRLEASRKLADAGDRRLASIFEGYAACASHLMGDVADARAQYRTTRRRLDSLGDARYALVFALHEVVAAIQLGEDHAVEEFERLIPHLEEMGDRSLLMAASIHSTRLGLDFDIDVQQDPGLDMADEEVRFANAF